MASTSASSCRPHQIFLSHSSQQKPFVEQLALDLRKVHQNPFFDAFSDSLPKGQPWPARIEEEARCCQLAVVVVSEDYFQSEWPMRELQHFVDSRRRLMPLFYKLSPIECTSHDNLTRWQSKWESLMLDSTKCKDALKELTKWSGETFQRATERRSDYSSEAAYRDRIVYSVCKLVPSEIAYDESYVKGRELLHEAVADTFIQAERKVPNSCIVLGMHGTGGTGKTTLCKIMVNFFYSHYGGKSWLMQLPTRRDEAELLRQCKDALRELAQVHESVLNKASDMDQIVTLYREHMRDRKFFLAIDNVWPGSQDYVEKILGAADFGAGTKVLITARSSDLLEDLLRTRCDGSIFLTHVPSVGAKFAFDIFLHYGHRKSSEWPSNAWKNIVAKCCFNNHYHPLLLRALGSHLRTKGADRNDLTEFVNRKHSSAIETVLDVMKTNYEDLRDDLLRKIFMDVALCLPICDLTSVSAVQWLSLLHGIDNKDMAEHIFELERGGLLDFHDGQQVIEVHDLYVEFAKRIATKCPRWVYCPSMETSSDFLPVGRASERKRKTGNAVKWSEVERVVLLSEEAVKWLKDMNSNRCSNVELVIAHWEQRNEHCDREASRQDVISVGSMTCLRILELKDSGCSSGLRRVKGLKNAKESLGRLVAEHCTCETREVGCLTALQTLILPVATALDLSRCTQLEHLALTAANGMRLSLEKSRMFDFLVTLEKLELYGFDLQKCGDGLKGLTALQELKLIKCELPREEKFRIRELKKLRRLDLSYSSGGRGCVDMLVTSNLKRIDLSGWTTRGFGVSKTGEQNVTITESFMEHLAIDGDQIICSTFPDLASLHLQPVTLLCEFESLEMLPDLSFAHQLETLELSRCASLTRFAGLPSSLKVLEVSHCGSLALLPDMSSVDALETLELSFCASLTRFAGLPSSLKVLEVSRCGSLALLPDMSSVDALETLKLWGCDSLTRFAGLPSSRKVLEVRDCGSLALLPDMNSLDGLETLSSSECGAYNFIFL